jgi:membrane associated rhomboid family serine protease
MLLHVLMLSNLLFAARAKTSNIFLILLGKNKQTMIFPIGDDQVKGGTFPLFSYAFIALNIVAFFFQLNFPNALVCEFGCIPNQIVNGQDYLTLFTSMFMHGGWMHLIGNMLFLWVFADNIEATVGNIPFLAFYMLGGLAASFAHIYFSYDTTASLVNCCNVCGNGGIQCVEEGVLRACGGSIPSVGASGAISAVLGAYLVMFPKSKVKVLVIYFFSSFRVPALYFLGFWIVQQLISGFASLGPETAQTDGVAWWAHIGGFAFGVLSGFFARDKGAGAIILTEGRSFDDRDMV